MSPTRRAILVGAGCGLLAACAATPGPPARARRQAAADLGCAEAELVYTRLGNDAYRIRGCGKQVDYTYACPRSGCRWMRDGIPRPAGRR